MVTLRMLRSSSGRAFGSPSQARPHHQRNVEVRADELVHPGESLGRDADDRELDPTELHAPAEDGGVGSELLLPQAVAENHDRVAAGDLVLLRPEVAAQLRLDAHDAEEVAAHEQAECQLWQRIAVWRPGPR